MFRRVEKMDKKILAAAFAATLLVFAGVAFAMPGWQKWDGNAQNGTGLVQPCMNGTWEGRGPGQGLALRANLTEQHTQFEDAVEAGDYTAAKGLHEQYGFGGPLFNKLDETTFAKYAQIHKLQQELRQELGLNETMGMGFGRAGFPGEPGMGRMESGRGQGRGMRHNSG